MYNQDTYIQSRCRSRYMVHWVDTCCKFDQLVIPSLDKKTGVSTERNHACEHVAQKITSNGLFGDFSDNI